MEYARHRGGALSCSSHDPRGLRAESGRWNAAHGTLSSSILSTTGWRGAEKFATPSGLVKVLFGRAFMPRLNAARCKRVG